MGSSNVNGYKVQTLGKMPGKLRAYTVRKNMIIVKTLGKVMGPTAYRNKNLEPTVASNVGSKARWNRKLEHPHGKTIVFMVRNMCKEGNVTGSTAKSEPRGIHMTMF